MDTSPASLLARGLAYPWYCPVSDSDLSSLSSPETLSPLGYLDLSLSPSDMQAGRSTPGPDRTRWQAAPGSTPMSHSLSGGTRKPGRSGRIRSKQRESASEKEKLRMRDLTKALHHLRSFLPPSVAPAGQTLTKIETLRLAIRYISHLSSQLGLSQDVLYERRGTAESSPSEASSPDSLEYFSSMAQWSGQPCQDPSPDQSQYQIQLPSQTTSVHSGTCGHEIDLCRYNSGQYSVDPQGDMFTTNMDISLLSPPTTHHSHCQMFGPLAPRPYWCYALSHDHQ